MCGRPITLREGERPSNHRRKRYCGRPCFGRSVSLRAAELRAAKAAANGTILAPRPEPDPEHYPGAAYATDREVPPVCPRCGGPWRQVPGGWACYLCGRDCYVASALRVAIQRTLAD